ncbi:MAG TPA: maleylpyruvate isomerase family mycothiol-dependent enzyme [Streptosporangiaceae bacterium]|nr:maleylpyruvate isomerase family mycothiol-dependent enzyme [Streptosporangiaceae bacterium]
MTVFDDLGAEQGRLEGILAGLDEAQWRSPSAAQGWTVADVVLHLAQSEEAVQATMTGSQLRTGIFAATGSTMDERAEAAVQAERTAPAEVFCRWQRAHRAAMAALTAGDPEVPVRWVTGPVKPATLATTRLAEHWAHGLDITGPLGLDYPDTGRLRHVAWLAHRTLPYALALAGEPADAAVRCELTAPAGSHTWRYGPPDAESVITGPAGEFCRVAVRRLAPADAGLSATGPHGAIALRVLRTYAQ